MVKKMSRYFITFSYDGSSFAGYQTQPGLRTVQEELEKALWFINNKTKTVIHASGRTDAKVHALNQTAHFDLNVTITPNKLKRALNSNLPADIHVKNAMCVSSDFHARYHVKEKEYCYYLNMGEYNPIKRNYVYQYNHELNIKAMKKAIKYLKGTHDFRAFVSENNTKENCVRTISKVAVRQNKQEPNQLEIYFKGTGFMKYQVRNMVGYLIKIGENKVKSNSIKEVLDSRDRMKAGKTAPAEGLYLKSVIYHKNAMQEKQRKK